MDASFKRARSDYDGSGQRVRRGKMFDLFKRNQPANTETEIQLMQ
jgi:hypothetical protein